jgi:hypothetical protein
MFDGIHGLGGRMVPPLQSTREAPVSATIRDCLVAAWVTDGTWTIDVGGSEFTGPAVDSTKHDSLAGVKDMLKTWAASHHELFD